MWSRGMRTVAVLGVGNGDPECLPWLVVCLLDCKGRDGEYCGVGVDLGGGLEYINNSLFWLVLKGSRVRRMSDVDVDPV